MLFDPTGGLSFDQQFSREVTAAALDGTLIAIADRAAVTPFRSLQIGQSALLVEGCRAGVLVSGARFVCIPFGTANVTFSTYDLDRSVKIGEAPGIFYVGDNGRRVPGRDAFITVSDDQSPSDFHLFQVDQTGAPVYVNDSPYHGDFPVTRTFAFDATPPTHVIQVTGLILALYGTTASPCTSDFPSSCFLKDGELGTLATNESFAALTENGNGHVIGLVSADGSSLACPSGCALQDIDVAARRATPLGSYSSKGASGRLIARSAPAPTRVLYVGYNVNVGTPAAGYRVDAFRY